MTRRTLLVLCLVLTLSAAKCGGGGAQVVDDVARQFSDDVAELAQRFGSSDGAVTRILDDTASRTGASREELARQWRAQPSANVVGAFGDEITNVAARQRIDEEILRAATCEAVEKVLLEQEVPTVADIREAVEAKLYEKLPGIGAVLKAESAAEDVGEAMNDVDAGFPAGARLRLLMLKAQHC